MVLFLLASGFALSQAFRTMGAILASPLQAHFALTPEQLGLWSSVFHFTFALAQLPIGVALDLFGPRRTVVCAFPLAALGAAMCAWAPSYGWLLLGQALIGLGCAPAFLACTVYIARHFDASRFAALSGLAMSFAGIGILYTGTPMAVIVGHTSWRGGYASMALLCVLAWVLIYTLVREPRAATPAVDPATDTIAAPARQRVSLWQALKELVPLLRMPHTAGLLCFALVSYAAFITVRGLWLGPLLESRHGLSLVAVGNVAMAMTVGGMVGPALFGRLDRGGRQRTTLMFRLAMLGAAMFVVLALSRSLWLDVMVPVAYGLLTGYGVLQYAYVKSAYPPHATGRAMALLNTSMFLGVGLMQWLTGVVAGWASQRGLEVFQAAFLAVALALACGALAFRLLPQAPINDNAPEGRPGRG